MTDSEARSMRFPDGAVGPAYNAQIAAAPKEGVIVSIDVADRRNEAGLAGPMVNDIVRRLTPLSVDQPNTVARARLDWMPAFAGIAGSCLAACYRCRSAGVAGQVHLFSSARLNDD
jgi:hypothetical protein